MKKLKGPIFLVGFMGSGKSYLSDSLTKSFPIFDMDNFLEKLESKTIGRIFIENGESYFRDLELRLIQFLCETNFKGLVNCGGGIGANPEASKVMKKHGIKVFLNTPVEKCWHRVKNGLEKRPLGKSKSDFFDLFKKRVRGYQEEAIEINGQLPIEQLQEKVLGLYS